MLFKGRILIVPPASPGSKGDEGMVRGALELLSGLTHVVILNPDSSPQWADVLRGYNFQELRDAVYNLKVEFNEHDILLILGADVIDGTCGLQPSVARLDLARYALSAGAKVIIACSFRSNVDVSILEKIRALRSATWLLRDVESLRFFEQQAGFPGRYFPDFSFFAGQICSEAVSDFIGTLKAERLLIGINFSEHAFRSFYDEHSLEKRREYITTITMSITDVYPDAQYILVSHDSRQWPNWFSDTFYCIEARHILQKEGFCTAMMPPNLNYGEVLCLLKRFGLLVTGRMHLAMAAFRSGVTVLITMGIGKSYSSVDKMKGFAKTFLGSEEYVITDLRTLKGHLKMYKDIVLNRRMLNTLVWREK